MVEIFEQRKNVGKGNEVEGALMRSVLGGSIGAAGDVVRAMVNQLGEDDAAIIGESTWSARQHAIFELAGKLGLEPALRTLYEQPVAPEGGRAPNGDGLQAEIVDTVDRGYPLPREP